MKKLLCLIVGLALSFMLLSFLADRIEKPRLTSDQIASSVPIGFSPAQVLAILDSKHIEHFPCEVDPGKGHFLVAISRGSKWGLIREDHAVSFHFDNTDHLISKEPHTWLTGP